MFISHLLVLLFAPLIMCATNPALNAVNIQASKSPGRPGLIPPPLRRSSPRYVLERSLVARNLHELSNGWVRTFWDTVLPTFSESWTSRDARKQAVSSSCTEICIITPGRQDSRTKTSDHQRPKRNPGKPHQGAHQVSEFHLPLTLGFETVVCPVQWRQSPKSRALVINNMARSLPCSRPLVQTSVLDMSRPSTF